MSSSNFSFPLYKLASLAHALAMILLTALALCLILEGTGFALFPEAMRRALLEISSLPRQNLRSLGGLALASGLLILFALRLLR